MKAVCFLVLMRTSGLDQRVGVLARDLPYRSSAQALVDIRAIGRAEAATSQLMQLVAPSLEPLTFRKCSQSSTSWQCWSVGRSS